MKRILCMLCVLTLILGEVCAAGTESEAVTVSLDATSYTTDGILIPYFTVPSGASVYYRYLKADTPDAPMEYWEEISYGNESLAASGSADAYNPGSAYLLMSQNLAGKYVRFELTVNGVKYLSEPTQRIAFSPNIINNAEFSPKGINSETGEIYGWSDGMYKNGALYSSGNENGKWYNKFTFPEAADGYKYNVYAEYKKSISAVRNFRASLGGTDSGNISGTALENGYTAVSEILKNGRENSISFRICSSASAGAAYFYIRNVRVTKKAPYASSVKIEESADGKSLIGSYRYESEYDYDGVSEGDSMYKWYISENPYGPWNVLEGENSDVLALKNAYADKYIKFEVTPVNGSFVKGTAQCSENTVKYEFKKGIKLLANDGYKTGKKISFAYKGEETGNIDYTYLVCSDPTASLENWTEIASGRISADNTQSASLVLDRNIYGKYICVRLETETDGIIISDPSPKIELSPNLGEPYAGNVYISGKVIPLRSVTGVYDYSGDIAEGNSLYAWYVSESRYGPWTKMDGAKEYEFEIPQSCEGKYIKFEVTPVNSDGISGITQSFVCKAGLSPGNTERILDENNPYLDSMYIMAEQAVKDARNDISTANVFALAWAYTANESFLKGNETVKSYFIEAMDLKCDELEQSPAGFWNSFIFDALYMAINNGGISSEKINAWKGQLRPSFDRVCSTFAEGDSSWINRAANTLAQMAAVLELGCKIYGDENYGNLAKNCAAKIAEKYQKTDGGYTYLDGSAATKVYLDFTALYLGRYYQLSKDETAGKSLKKFADYAKFYSVNGHLESSSTPWWKKSWGTSGAFYGMEVAAGISGDAAARKVAETWEKQRPLQSYVYYAMYFWDGDTEVGEIPTNLKTYNDTIRGPVLRNGAYQVVMTGAPYSDTGIGISVASEKNIEWNGYLETAAIAVLGKDAEPYQNTSGIVSGIADLNKQDYVIGDDFIALAKTHDLKHAYTGSTADPSGKGFKSTQIYYADENGAGGWIEVEATSKRKGIDGPLGVLKLSDIASVTDGEIISNALSYKITGNDVSGVTAEGTTAYVNFKNGGSRDYEIGESFGFGLSVAETGKTIPTVTKYDEDLVKISVNTEDGEVYLLFNPTDANITVDTTGYRAITAENDEFTGNVLNPYELIVLKKEADTALYFEENKAVARGKCREETNVALITAVYSLNSDNSEMLLFAEATEGKAKADEEYILEKEVNVPEGSGYIIRAFLWNKDTIKPLTESQRREINE